MTFLHLDVFITGLVYLAAVFALFFLGKWLFNRRHPDFNVQHELFENDNVALAIAVVGYFSGLVFALGGTLAGDGVDLGSDLFDIFFFGFTAIILLHLGSLINDKIAFPQFNNSKEIITDRNAGAGAIAAGNQIATGLIVAGAVSGQYVDLITATAFWLLGQVALVVVLRVYDGVVSFDLHDEIERDNVAVGVAVSGLMIAVGNLVRLSISGDFEGWTQDLGDFAIYFGMGLLILPLVRWVSDKVLLPGVSLNHELVGQKVPNVGAGIIEAFSYIAASMLIGWAIH